MRVSFERLVQPVLALTLTLAIGWSAAVAQVNSLGDPAGTIGGLGGSGTGTSDPAGAAPGGAAMADFDTLINLIQQTVDPDSWLAAGGTSSILPYPSGVYVDPAGHLKRVRETEPLAAELLMRSDLPRHPWRTPSALRIVSLKGLDQALFNSALKGLGASAELMKLAGLSKIEYVKIDAATEDILIAGPAVNQAFGFELQDLAVVAALINSKTAPLGCSIEPSDAGLLAAQELIRQDGAIKRLARNPRLMVQQMQDKIGAHNVRVFGMNPSTGTAVALIDADEHMKKVGFGTIRTRTPISSYFDYLDQQDKVPSQSLIRWWFAYGDETVRVNATVDMFQLPEQCVAVLSEQQWVSAQGRAPTGSSDAAADAFAEGMTRNLATLRGTHPAYARLCAVFEIGLALQLATEATGQPSLQAWFPSLCAIGSSTPEENVEPKTVEGLTTWHRLKNGTTVAVVSGGVKVDARSMAVKKNWQPSKYLVHSLVPEPPERPSLAHGSWWWDQR